MREKELKLFKANGLRMGRVSRREIERVTPSVRDRRFC